MRKSSAEVLRDDRSRLGSIDLQVLGGKDQNFEGCSEVGREEGRRLRMVMPPFLCSKQRFEIGVWVWCNDGNILMSGTGTAVGSDPLMQLGYQFVSVSFYMY